MMESYLPKIKVFILTYGIRVLGALAVLLAGWIIIKWVTKFMRRLMDKKGVDVSLESFLIGLVSILLKVLLFISVVGMVGIETTSFVAMIGAGGLAIGLALQGTLANFAGGVLILVLRPFHVGDLIESMGHFGYVKEIQIFVTKIVDPLNRLIVIPNGVLSNSEVKNFTELGKVKVDLKFSIAYGADLKKAQEVLYDVMIKHDLVLKEPEPFVGVHELADSGVNLSVWPYCKSEGYWKVYFDIYEQGKLALDAAKVTIPFPQMDVHIKKDL